MQVDSQLPVYVNETKYFRQILGVSWEWASHLRRIGIIEPDAFCSNGRGALDALYLLNTAAMQQTKARIRDYRRLSRARITHNLPPLCHA